MKARLLLSLARPTSDRSRYSGGCRLPYARRVFSLLGLLLLLNQTASWAQCFQNIVDPTAYHLLPVGSKPYAVAKGDFNGDGKADLVTANYFGSTVSVLLGDGAGGFGNRADFAVGNNPSSVAVGDFNGDGKADLATANFNDNTVSVLLGDGTGGFAKATDFAVGSRPTSVAVGDVNRDGKADLVTANNGSGTVSVLLGNGQGSFGNRTDFAVGSSPQSVAVRDLNGDSKPDLVTANAGSKSVTVLLGDGAGSFGNRADFSVGGAISETYSVAVGDVNGDGKPDLVTANFFDNVADIRNNTVSVLYNCTNFPMLVSTSASPNPVCAGSSLALSATVTGGSAPYSFSWAAPAGITLSATSTSAVSASVGAGVSGVQTITLTAAASTGTPSTTHFVSVTVNAAPTATLRAGATPPQANVGAVVSLTASASGATGPLTYQWSAPGSASLTSPATSSAVLARLTTAGLQTFTLVATSGNCSQSALVSVTALKGPDLTAIVNLPDANFAVGKPRACCSSFRRSTAQPPVGPSWSPSAPRQATASTSTTR